MNVFAAILINQRSPVCREQNGNRVGHKNSSGSYVPGDFEQGLIAHSGIIEIDVVHQVMQSHMSVIASHARDRRESQPGEGGEGVVFVAEAGENQVEPDYVGLYFTQSAE